MFTGIIKAVAKIRKAERKKVSLFLTIAKPKGWKIKQGDSIATDGVCLTVKRAGKTAYLAELMPETLKRTSFGRLVPQKVNLEQSLRSNDLLGGHLVMGHVDAVGRIKKKTRKGRALVYQIQFPKKYRGLVAEKGAIAVDGVSLTVVAVGDNWFTVSLVDYTIKHTVLGEKAVGDLVNLEFDILAKYLSKIITYNL